MKMDWKFLEDIRVLGAKYVPQIEADFKTIFGEDIFKIWARKENKEHPWHIASKDIISGKFIDPYKEYMKHFYSQAAQFLYFFTAHYNGKQQKAAVIRIKTKETAESIIFEYKVGINFVWMQFYEVKATNIEGANHDFLLIKGKTTIGVECSIKIEKYDFDILLRKMDEKLKVMRHDIPYFLAIHIPEQEFKRLFPSDSDRKSFGSRLQGKFKNNPSSGKINKVFFSTGENLNLGFHNPHTIYNIPDDFPIMGSAKGHVY